MFSPLLDALFGPTPSMEEVITRKKFDIQQVMREFERERKARERERTRMIPEMKRLARDGQMRAVKTMARDMHRIQKQSEQLVNARVQMRTICTQLDSMRTTHELSTKMHDALRVMHGMTHAISLDKLQRMMEAFAKQNGILQSKNDAIEKAIDGAAARSDDEEEEAAVVQRILDDVGIDLSQQLVSTPTASIAHQSARGAHPSRLAQSAAGPRHASDNGRANDDDDDDDANGTGNGGNDDDVAYEAMMLERLRNIHVPDNISE